MGRKRDGGPVMIHDVSSHDVYVCHQADAEAHMALQRLARQAGQIMRSKAAASRREDRAILQKQLEQVQLQIRRLRHRLHG